MKSKQILSNLKLKNLPIDERPREKVLLKGVHTLSSIELLAILLQTGTVNESVLQLAERLLEEAGGLINLSKITLKKLKEIKGIGNAKAVLLFSAIELGKRINALPENNNKKITSSKDAANFFMSRLRYAEKEMFYILLLTTKCTVINDVCISVGSLNSSLVHPREIFREAILNAAAQIILVHNHPSGDITPSIEDINITKRITEAGLLMGINVLDHIIIGDGNYYSFNDNKNK